MTTRSMFWAVPAKSTIFLILTVRWKAPTSRKSVINIAAVLPLPAVAVANVELSVAFDVISIVGAAITQVLWVVVNHYAVSMPIT